MMPAIRLIIFLFIISFELLACNLKDGRYGLFSGAVTSIIKSLNLEKSDKIILYSNFFPIDNSKAKEVTGGIFLSQKELRKLDIEVFFYDKSNELKKIIEQSEINKIMMLDTNGLVPFTAFRKSLDLLKPYLVDCREEIKELEEKVQDYRKNIASFKSRKFVFFLGELKNNDYPNLVIGNDGFVKYLVERKKIKTYPSELSYINWSQRILQKLKSKKYTMIGVSACDKRELQITKLNESHYNICSNKILIPGLSQIESLNELNSLFEMAL